MTPSQTQLRQDRLALERELQAAGGEIRGNAAKCPFHDDRHASGSIYRGEDGSWHFKCHVCDAGGDIYDIRAQISGRPLAEVLREAADPRPRHSTEPPPNGGKVYKTLGDLRLAVAQGGEIEAEYGEGYADPDTGEIDFDVFRLRTSKGKTFRQAHPVSGGWSMTAGPKPWPLYQRGAIRNASEIVVAEGEKSVDALHAIGIPATTSPCGAGKAKYADWSPLAGKTVYLWPDNDQIGREHMKAVQGILARLDPRPEIRLIEPGELDLEQKEDAYDFIAQYRVAGIDAREAVRGVLAKARRIDALSDYRERQVQIARGQLRTIPLPWSELERLTRANQPGRVTIVGGTKGAAKSFLRQTCQRHWLQLGERVALYLLEGSVAEELDRALAQLTGNGGFTDLEWQRANPDDVRVATEEHAEELARLGGTITRAPLGATVDDLAAWLKAEAARHRILIADPITMAATVRNPWDDSKRLMDAAKHAAETHGCSIWFVTHLQKGAEAGTSDRLAGGASFERFADTIIQLHRHDSRASLVWTPVGRAEMRHNQTVFIEKARAPGTGFRLAYTFAMADESGNIGPLVFDELGIIIRKKG